MIPGWATVKARLGASPRRDEVLSGGNFLTSEAADERTDGWTVPRAADCAMNSATN